MLRAAFALSVLGLLGCGTRTELDDGGGQSARAGGASGTSSSTGGAVGCDSTLQPDAYCRTWAVAGPSRMLVATPTDASITLGSLLTTHCGYLVAWSTLAGAPNDMTLAWSTQLIGLDGEPLGPVREHPGLNTNSSTSGTISLASRGLELAALASDTSCKFVRLDRSGADVGAVVSAGEHDCIDLAPTHEGYSFLRLPNDFTSALTLVALDTQGAPLAQRDLPKPARRTVWNRLPFDDDTFLLNTFAEDDTTTVYTVWLQHFDARGFAMDHEHPTFAHTAPVAVAGAAIDLLTVWAPAGGQSMEASTVDSNGLSTGPVVSLEAPSANYGFALSSTPGDVMLTWLELDPKNDWRFSVVVLDPTGRAFGAPTRFGTDAIPAPLRTAVVGSHAIVVFQSNGGIRAQPLVCSK